MPFSRLKDKVGRADHQDGPVVVDAGEVAPGAPWGTRAEGVREVRHVRWAPGRKDDEERPAVLSGWLLALAAVIVAASAVGAGYVSYGAQKLFAIAHLAGVDKGHHRASIIAALPDAGWIAMALVGLAAALRCRSSLRARAGVLLFFGLSLAAQMMYAPRDPRGLLVAVIAPIALAWMLESLIVEVRHWAAVRLGLPLEESPILTTAFRGLGRGIQAAIRFPLWMVRLCLDWSGTRAGVREWVLDVAPLAPGRTRASLRADEAVARAGTAEQIAEQARQQAAALIQQARTDADGRIAQAGADAAEQVEQMRTRLSEQLREASHRYEQRLAEQAHESEQQLQRLAAANTELTGQVDQLREQLEVLSGSTTAKARLYALYEQVGRDGDPRYLDSTKIREMARELGPRAGLQSVGTADAYLRQYIATKTSGSDPVRGRGNAGNSAMIVNGV